MEIERLNIEISSLKDELIASIKANSSLKDEIINSNKENQSIKDFLNQKVYNLEKSNSNEPTCYIFIPRMTQDTISINWKM
jgi:hypothetical protein